MAYSDSFPAIRPSFQFSADAGRLDPRISYSRSTTGTYFGTDKHLSSENLFLQSSDFDTTWSKNLVTLTGGQTDPSGGTDGFTLTEDSSNNYHRVYQSITASGSFAFTIYAKQNSGTRYLTLTIKNANNDWVSATYDLAGNPPATGSGSSSNFSDLSATQTASGNGYYKCVLKATGSTSDFVYLYMSDDTSAAGGTYGLKTYAGDGSSSIDVAFASLSTTGATDYNATTTQIHREYAPTLQTAAINAPRFEYSATDSASMGLLVEGQATNINTYSKGGVNGSGVVQWQVDNGSATGNSAVGPDGTLSALHFVPNTTTTAHYAYNNAGSAPSGSTPHTISVYAKAAGYSDIVIRLTSSYSAFANTINATFTLTGDGSVSVTGGTATAAIESCGNGWYRCQVTETTSSSPTGMRPYIYAKQVASYAGDGFSGVLLWGWQVEANSFASSFVDTGTSGSTATRAADSASMVSSSLFDNGSGGLVAEYNMFAASETSYVAHLNKTSGGTNGAGAAITNRYVYVENNYLDISNTSSNTFHKVAASWEAASQKISRDGSAAAENTSTVVPSGIDKLYIGQRQDGGEPVNGHIRRLAIYSEPLSSTNLQALTS